MSYHDTSHPYIAPRTAARLAREVQELLKLPEEGVKLIVDEATGLPPNLQELTVRSILARPLSATFDVAIDDSPLTTL